MTRPTTRLAAATALMCLLASDPDVQGQGATLGTFRWQLQPFCNTVVVTVTQQGGTYTVDGFDDQCGAPQRAPLVGLATPNPDGSIGLGLQVVTVPGGRALALEARITLATLSGPWTDSAGNTGTFAFNGPGGGTPRPAPTVPMSALSPGAVGAVQINQAQVQARFSGTCPKGHALTGVEPGGAVRCTAASTTADTVPVVGSGLAASMTIGTDHLPIVSHVGGAGVGSAGVVLRLTHCGNPTCSASNITTTVANLPSTSPGYSSIAIGADGLPIVADGNTQVLRVTHCGNVRCTGGNVSTAVTNFGGQRPSLAIGTDGLPIITGASGVTGSILAVTHCGTVDCSSGNLTTRLDVTSNDVGEYSAIAIGADGLPVISYSFGSANALRVAHCGNVTCTAGNTYTTVDDLAGGVGTFNSIAIGADGLPIISHRATAAAALRVTHCGNAACTSGNVSTTVDDISGDVGESSSLRIGRDGLAVISHVNRTTGMLRLSRCGNGACTTAVSRDLVPTLSPQYAETSLAIDPFGLPIVAHTEPSPTALGIVRCGTPTCQ